MQLTGRVHYDEYGKSYRWPLVTTPDIADDSWGAAVLLGRFLSDHEPKIRAALRRGDMRIARREVNGGSNGLSVFISAMKAGRAFMQQRVAEDASQRVAALTGTR